MTKQKDFLLWVTDNFYTAVGVPHLWYKKPVQSPAVPQGGLTAEQLESEFNKLGIHFESWLHAYEEGSQNILSLEDQMRLGVFPTTTVFKRRVIFSTNDYQLLISINSIPHLCIRKSHLTGFQGYIKGEQAQVWYIEFYTKYGNFVSEYDNKEIWEQVLKALGEAKIFKPQL